MILVCLSIVVLASSRLPPKTFCELEGTGDRVVKNAIVFAGLAGESDGEHAGLNAQLEDATAVRAWGREGAFRALIPSSRASGDTAELWPGVVVWEHCEMIEADRKRRGRERRRKQEGERKGTRGNSCNWRMASPLSLYRGWEFSIAHKSISAGFQFVIMSTCSLPALSITPSISGNFGATILPGRLSPPPSHAESPLLPQKIGTDRDT